VKKENESRLELAKAFLYALCYAKIRYAYLGKDVKFAYGDAKNGADYDFVYYNGESIPLNKVNRMMNWLADREELVSKYASQFDTYINKEISDLEEYTDSVSGYKQAVTTQADILRQLRFRAIRAVEVLTARDGKVHNKKEEDDASIISLAWDLHVSEEREVDKDYGELIIDMLCEIIKRYAQAPFKSQDIRNKKQGSESYIRYVETCEHIASKFLYAYAEDIAKKLGKEISEAAETEAPETVEETKKVSKARETADLTDGESVAASIKNITNSKEVEEDKRFAWAKKAFYKFLTSEI
jgi:hypothetical protein